MELRALIFGGGRRGWFLLYARYFGEIASILLAIVFGIVGVILVVVGVGGDEGWFGGHGGSLMVLLALCYSFWGVGKGKGRIFLQIGGINTLFRRAMASKTVIIWL
jgi:hypothetical protein